jgi:hypothetical protein
MGETVEEGRERWERSPNKNVRREAKREGVGALFSRYVSLAKSEGGRRKRLRPARKILMAFYAAVE